MLTGLDADAAHSLPKGILIFPLAAGVQYRISPKISLMAETTYRYMSTDYLDGFSQAANPSKGDYYHSHSIGIVYKFGVKNMLDCPVVRN